MTTIAEVVARLEPTLVTVVQRGDDQPLAGIVLYDCADPTEVGRRDLVLAIGAHDEDEVVETIGSIAGRRPAGIVVRSAITQDRAAAAAKEAGLWLLRLESDASWMRAVQLLHGLVEAETRSPGPGDPGGDDLFAMADAIAAMLDAPVTIEDPASRVLAFSDRQDETDIARRATILGRKAPAEYVERMRDRGVFKRIREAPGPIIVAGRPPDILPRVVAPVRAGGEFLGSVWAVVKEPLNPERERALDEAAPMVALHLLRARALSDARRSDEIEAVVQLVRGGAGAIQAVRRFQLTAPAYVVAVASIRDLNRVYAEPALSRLWDFLRVQLMAGRGRAVVAQLHQQVYAVIGLHRAADGIGLEAGVRGFLERLREEAATSVGQDVLLAVGGQAGSVAEVPRSALQAERTLQAMRRLAGPPVADIIELGPHVLLDVAVEALEREPDLGSGPLGRLAEYDRDNATQFVATTRAWLDALGSSERAATALGVHANTVRYRIKQIKELGLADLDDPLERLALTLHLYRQKLAE